MYSLPHNQGYIYLTFPAGGFHNTFSQAGKTIRTEFLWKKNLPLDDQTRQAKSSSEPVHLPGVCPLYNEAPAQSHRNLVNNNDNDSDSDSDSGNDKITDIASCEVQCLKVHFIMNSKIT